MLFIKDKNKYSNIIKEYCGNINDKYLDNIISDSKSKLLVYCINRYFNENETRSLFGSTLFKLYLSRTLSCQKDHHRFDSLNSTRRISKYI